MARGKYQQWLTEDGLLQLEAWARDGLTDEDIANNMGIATGTLYVYKDKYHEINEALKRGKDVADIRVENALYKSALGYTYTETEKWMEKDASGKEVQRVKKNEKYQAPNTTAIIFWLKNRRPERWRERTEATISGDIRMVQFVDDIK